MKKRREMPRCVIDSGGLSAMQGHSERARLWLRWVLDHIGSIQVPSPILVECTTGDGVRDAEANRILNVLSRSDAAVVCPDEETARVAGRLRYEARTDDGVDALVAAVAVGNGSPAVVLTSDPTDLQRLLARERHVKVRAV